MEANKKISNYEKCCQDWRKKLAQADREELESRIPELIKNENGYVLRHFDRELLIDKEDFFIRCLSDSDEVNVTEQLNVYTYLWHRKGEARLSGNWVPFRDVPGAGPFGPAFQKGVNQVLADSFSGKMECLERACVKMGGKPLKQGDVGFELLAFPGIPIQIFFWDGDEEFEAQANVLFDKNAGQFIHVESLVSIAHVALARALRLGGVSMVGSTFGME